MAQYGFGVSDSYIWINGGKFSLLIHEYSAFMAVNV